MCRQPPAARSPCPCWRSGSASRTSPKVWSSRSRPRPRFPDDVRRIDQEFFRNAAADHAGAAHSVFFGDQHPRAVAGGDPGGTYSARTSPDDEQIDVELSHGHPARILFFDAFSSREPASTSLENAMEI